MPRQALHFEGWGGAYHTSVVRTPRGWLVTHSVSTGMSHGGTSVHSIIVEDPDHVIDPRDFCLTHKMTSVGD